jgi:hypothetical protein
MRIHDMGEKFDLARMLREINEETGPKSVRLTQEEIKRLVAEKKKTAAVAQTDASKSRPR